MRKIEIGDERFTAVYAVDEPTAGGASHEYVILTGISQTVGNIKFQKGPVKQTESNGCFIEDLIVICMDRLNGFQSGDFACVENAEALRYLAEALEALDDRTKDRQARKVEGTFKK